VRYLAAMPQFSLNGGRRFDVLIHVRREFSILRRSARPWGTPS